MNIKCSICGKSIEGYGNNPYPVDMHPDHKCCDQCNATVVIPARLTKMSHYDKVKAQVYATGNKWAIENFHATHD